MPVVPAAAVAWAACTKTFLCSSRPGCAAVAQPDVRLSHFGRSVSLERPFFCPLLHNPPDCHSEPARLGGRMRPASGEPACHRQGICCCSYGNAKGAPIHRSAFFSPASHLIGAGLSHSLFVGFAPHSSLTTHHCLFSSAGQFSTSEIVLFACPESYGMRNRCPSAVTSNKFAVNSPKYGFV